MQEPATCAYVVEVCARLACETPQEKEFWRWRPDRTRFYALELRQSYKQRAKALFERGYDAYVKHAEPEGNCDLEVLFGGPFDLVKLPLVTLVDPWTPSRSWATPQNFRGTHMARLS